MRTLTVEHITSRTKQGRRIRALDISGKDRELLLAIADPAFTVSGITNGPLREKLQRTPWGAGRTDKQLSARITRHLAHASESEPGTSLSNSISGSVFGSARIVNT